MMGIMNFKNFHESVFYMAKNPLFLTWIFMVHTVSKVYFKAKVYLSQAFTAFIWFQRPFNSNRFSGSLEGWRSGGPSFQEFFPRFRPSPFRTWPPCDLLGPIPFADPLFDPRCPIRRPGGA
jgi:hypothetical protein